MERFIDTISETLGQYVPSVIGAILVFAAGYLLAQLVKTGLTALLDRLGFDNWLKSKIQRDLKLESFVVTVVYGLLLLYITLIALGVLGIKDVMEPAQNMLSKLLAMVPNVIAAGFIGVAGYIVARIVSSAVKIVTGGLDRYASKAGLGPDFKLSNLLGVLTFILILLPLLVSALDALKIEAISAPATQMLTSLLDIVPNILGAVVILGVAYIVGSFVRGLLIELLKSLGTDGLAEKAGTGKLFGHQGLSTVIGNLVFFFILLGAALSAVETLQLERLASVLDRLLVFSGQVVIGLVIIVLGNFLASLAYNRLSQGETPNVLAGFARIAILGFVFAMGLRAMGIGEDIVNLAFGLTLGAVAVAVALSFGLGGREAAGKQLDHWLGKWRGSAKH